MKNWKPSNYPSIIERINKLRSIYKTQYHIPVKIMNYYNNYNMDDNNRQNVKQRKSDIKKCILYFSI